MRRIGLADAIQRNDLIFTGRGSWALTPKQAFCRIAVMLRPSSDSDIKIELWLPTASWNGKFQAVGNGAFTGAINYAAMTASLDRGYATASTDTGHAGDGARWSQGHPEKVIDFGWRAVHEIKQFVAERSIFRRCERITLETSPSLARVQVQEASIMWSTRDTAKALDRRPLPGQLWDFQRRRATESPF